MFNSWTLFGDYFKWHGSIATDFEKASFGYCKLTLWKEVLLIRKDNTEAHDTIDANHESTYQWLLTGKSSFECLYAPSIWIPDRKIDSW